MGHVVGTIGGGSVSVDQGPGNTPEAKSYCFRLRWLSTDAQRSVGVGSFSSYVAAKAGIPYYRAWLERECETMFRDGPGQWKIVKELYFDVDR